MKCLYLSKLRKGRIAMNKLAGKDIENHYFRKRAVRMFALLSAVVCAVIFSAALVLEFDTEKGVYAQNAVFAPLAETAAVLCSLAAAIMCVFIPKEKETARYPNPMGTPFLTPLKKCCFLLCMDDFPSFRVCSVLLYSFPFSLSIRIP